MPEAVRSAERPVATAHASESGPTRGQPGGRAHGTTWWQRTVPARWLTPSTALIILVVVFPAVYMVWTSFLRIDRIGQVRGFAGLENYRKLLAEPVLGQIVLNTLLWLVVVVGVTVLLSLGLAQFLAKPFVGRRFVRLALIVPWATSLVMTATVWRFIYEGGNGLLNRLLMDLSIIGAPVEWYKDPAFAFYSIMAVGVVTSIPFTTYVLLSGLQTIPDDVLEAARIDGAGGWTTWRHITLPLLRPSLLVALVLNMLHVFNAFTVIWVIAGKTAGYHADTTVTWMYKIAFVAQLDPGEASALAVLNVAFLIVLVLAYVRVLRPDREAAAPTKTSATGRPSGLRHGFDALALSVWKTSRSVAAVCGPLTSAVGRSWRRVRPVGLSLAGLGVALFFLAPYVVMLLGSLKTDAELFAVPASYLPQEWAWSNYVDVWKQIPLAEYFGVSLTVALVSTAVVLVLAAPAAYILARTRFRGKVAFLGVILVTQMFPAVALLIGLYREALFLDGVHSYWFIIAVNSAFNLAFAIWILHAHVGAVSVEIDEAAMLDGLGRFRIMLRMILPLTAPGLITVTIFTFIQVWNEFVIALTLFNDPTAGRVPLTVGVQQFVGLYETNYQYLFAAALIAIIPAVLLFSFIEKRLISGLSMGSSR
ncbi:multiple sugar transport system permease protein [Amycolatopsis marina]|uniref:Multiple sugar transport system permease protein n=1 Tax=Amycolatopsis marina TaxID=490629 RepID=A0A1I0WMJ7_9PSEU|nr:ABC transporter permease subunit [Amycolatopsis marina]SFA89607.1 multiple sugar transport system permease protein [Amycolatopsis marina]